MSNFVCNNCGSKQKRWSGKCPDCDQWNCISEDSNDSVSSNFNLSGKKKFESKKIEVVRLKDQKEESISRITSNISEVDRVLGGGFVDGSVVLIGGEPGIGKSTILLQIAGNFSKENNVIYVSGEESASQVFMRANRLKIHQENITIISSGSVLDILINIDKDKPKMLIIDSIQTVYVSTVESNPGTVNQIRASTFELINYCKNNNIILVIVGHVTKDGHLAGPKLLEHMVDVVVYFEGDHDKNLRILRCVKNRFGCAFETGIFTMEEGGLRNVENPSSLFTCSEKNNDFNIVFAAMEGTRPVMVNIESLVASSFLPSPRRNVIGCDLNRMSMIVAVLQNRCGIPLYDKDIYFNISGGFKTNDTGIDFAVAISLTMCVNKDKIKENTVVIGEISLSGEIKQVPWMEKRINEAIKLGYKKFIIPNVDKIKEIDGIEIIKCKNIRNICNYNKK